ncbi:MAG: PorT family protein [Oscillospiraceae bacterium]|nr:PorT family protein [Oscillospiraceae bacterium]
MKKLIAVAAAIAMFAVSAHAQLGIVAGLTSNSSDLKSAYSDIVENQSVTQYHAGVVLRLGLPLGFYVQPGLVYEMKGESLKDQIATEEVSINTKTGFLEVPVQAGWRLDLGGVAPYVFLEPYVGYAITTETKTEAKNAASQAIIDGVATGLGLNLNTDPDDPNKWDGRNRLQYGVGVGGGILLLDKLAVSLKWYWDFGNLYNEDGQSSLSAQAMYEAAKNNKANGIALTATLFF